jgi:hypothetical protein
MRTRNYLRRAGRGDEEVRNVPPGARGPELKTQGSGGKNSIHLDWPENLVEGTKSPKYCRL